MTYTFKLSRRLAVSRPAALLIALLVLVGCSDDATAPDAGPLQSDPTPAIRVVPSSVTIETNQRIQFRGALRAHGRDGLSAPLAWAATGGAIDATGQFAATMPGTYKVVGRGRGRQGSDTATVVVVPTSPSVVRVSLTPDSVALTPAGAYAFAAVGLLSDGSTTPIGVTWQAAGGAIDAAGLYTAGDTTGTFRVIASNTAGTLADTSRVTIGATAPTPAPSPAPAPTLARVYLTPASATLSTGASKQFLAYGKTSAGDSVAVTVSFAGTGGSMSATGFYTAGPTSGTYRVIASSNGLADTSAVTVAAAATLGAGLDLGPFNATVPTTPGTMYLNAQSPSNLKMQLASARADGYHIFAITAGGSHKNYLDPATGRWSFALWKAAGVDRYRADSLVWRNYIADGTLVGVSLVDEPQCAACWGGSAIPWVLMDSAAKLSKTVFKGVPHFTRTDATQFGGYPFKHLDGGMLQYGQEKGDLSTWTANQLATARANGYALMVGVNAARGGKVVSGCIPSPVSSTACAMSATELTTAFKTLAGDETVVCGLTAWGPDATWWNNYLNQGGIRSALSGVATWAKGRAKPVCLKR